MKRKSVPSRHESKNSNTIIIYLIIFLLIILASISWVQNNTEQRKFAQEATPLLRCESPCTYNSQCPTGLFCYNNTCRNPQCKDAADCTCVIIDPNAPTNTPRPPTPTKTAIPTPTKTVTPTPTPASGLLPTIVVISPVPTNPDTVTPTPIPVFEIDKEDPSEPGFLEVILNVFAEVFCRIFGC